MAIILHETEERIKRAIRDILAIDPLIGVTRLKQQLLTRGFHGAHGNAMDWRYVAKLVRKITREGAMSMDRQKLSDRILPIKERFRLMAEELIKTIYWTPPREGERDDGMAPPTRTERMKAIELLMKLDLAILKAEVDVGAFEHSISPEEQERLRAKPLSSEALDRIAATFERLGVVAPRMLVAENEQHRDQGSG